MEILRLYLCNDLCKTYNAVLTFCSGIHVHVDGGIQLFPATEDREDEQKNGSLWKAVQLPASMRARLNV